MSKKLLARVERFERGHGKYKYTAVLKEGTVVNGKTVKRVNFGHKDYEQFRDSVPISMGGGLWSHKNHGNDKRRQNYRSRHAGVKLTTGPRSGTPAYRVKYTPSWFSYHFLW